MRMLMRMLIRGPGALTLDLRPYTLGTGRPRTSDLGSPEEDAGGAQGFHPNRTTSPFFILMGWVKKMTGFTGMMLLCSSS